MTLKTSKLRDAITFALVAGSTAMAGTSVAFAQDTDTASQATTLDRIEVTGSRIRSADLETQQPVFVIDRATIEQQGVTSVADILQNLSTNGAAINRTFNNGGDGSSGVDLRGLGSARTLVLVNGRRWVSALDSTVDLNTIPVAMVERIEVLKDGASSIYGSDAIAGVVNLITRKNFDGAEIRGYYGQFDKGDGVEQSVDMTIGASGERSNIIFGAAFTKFDAVSAGNRAISRDPVAGLGASQYSSVSDSGVIWQPIDAAGNPIWPEQFATEDDYWDAFDNVARSVINPGGESNNLDDYHPFSAADAYNFAADNYLLTPSERKSIFTQGRFDITDQVAFHAEALYNERESAQLLAGFPLTAGFYLAGDRGLSADSYFNPYRGTAEARNLDYGRRVTEQSRSYKQSVKTYNFYAGLEGAFEAGDRFFTWDAGWRYSKTDQYDTQIGDINMANLEAGTGPSFLDTDGIVRCGAPGAVIDGCVPVNVLSPAGGMTQEMMDFILFNAHDNFQNVSQGMTANLSGELFDLPGGKAGFAVGYEHRNESGYDEPDAFVAAGLTSGNARQPTSGQYKLDEVYVELALPLLSGVPGADLLELSIASRYSDYSNFGDTINSKFGFKWKPVADVLVRGNWSEGFRAPSITNLFRGASDSYTSYGDPCSADSPYFGNAGVAERCYASGVPVGFIQQTNQGFGYTGQTIFPFQLGGNVNAMPETAVSKTLGVVYSPSWVQGLDISLDWYNISIDGALGTPAANFILEQCYVEGNAEWCGSDNFTRDGAGRIDMMYLVPRNLSQREIEGYDLTVKYRLPETSVGNFAFTWDNAYISYDNFKSSADADWENSIGIYTEYAPGWRIRSNLTTDWSYGDFGVSWTMRYRSKLVEACAGTTAAWVDAGLCSDPGRRVSTGGAPRNDLDAVLYHDLEARYNTPWNGTVALGAHNLFDEDPPVSGQAFANSFDPQYDVPGTFYYMRYIQRF